MQANLPEANDQMDLESQYDEMALMPLHLDELEIELQPLSDETLEALDLELSELFSDLDNALKQAS